MAERSIQVVSALDGVATPGRYGAPAGAAGVVAREIKGVALATVTARKGRIADLAVAARSAFGVDLPLTPRRVEGREMAFVWSGPGQWLATCRALPATDIEMVLQAALAGRASIVDQSHGRTIVRVSGPRVRDALANGVAVDLHPSRFGTGDTAVTVVAHVNVHFWQIDAAPTYDFAVARGFAASFWHWLQASSAEYGLDIVRT